MAKKRNFIKFDSNGEELGDEKASAIAAICDEPLDELPKFEWIPHGLILIIVADNSNEKTAEFEGEVALICDTRASWNKVKKDIEKGADTRPMQFFLVKREWVEKMAAHELESRP